MIPCIATIRKGKKRRRFFFLTGSFSIGIKKEDDLIICHPGVFDRSIKVADGKVVRGVSDVGNERKTSGGLNPRRIVLGNTSISMTCLQLKFFLPIAIIFGGLWLVGLFLTPSKGDKIRQDWAGIALPSNGPYGNLKQDRAHPRGVRFTFSLPRDGRGRLNFTPGGLGDGLTLFIEIDGHPTPGRIAVPRGWGKEVSVPIPTLLSLQAPHDMVIRPSENTGPVRSWGIKNVRIQTRLPEEKGGDAIWEKMEKVRSILEDPMAGGREISQCYLIVRDGIRYAGDRDSGKKLESMRTAVEEKMQALLRKTVIKSKSLIASGQISKAREEMDDLKVWVPGAWMDGKRELDEAESMFD